MTTVKTDDDTKVRRERRAWPAQYTYERRLMSS